MLSWWRPTKWSSTFLSWMLVFEYISSFFYNMPYDKQIIIFRVKCFTLFWTINQYYSSFIYKTATIRFSVHPSGFSCSSWKTSFIPLVWFLFWLRVMVVHPSLIFSYKMMQKSVYSYWQEMLQFVELLANATSTFSTAFFILLVKKFLFTWCL